ncbi:hypothetical protein D3C81_1357470 [compost metagenome]
MVGDGCALVEVLGGLIDHHIQCIVARHQAHQSPNLVQHRHGQQVVLADQAGHFFLAGRGANADDLVHHDLLDRRLGGGQDQLAQGQRTAQVALLVEYIRLIDGFGIGSLAAQHVDGLACAEAGIQARVFAGHQVTGRAFAVALRVKQVVTTGLGSLAQVER